MKGWALPFGIVLVIAVFAAVAREAAACGNGVAEPGKRRKLSRTVSLFPSFEELFAIHCYFFKDGFQQASADVLAGMHWHNGGSAVGMPVEAMAPFLPNKLEPFPLQEPAEFAG